MLLRDHRIYVQSINYPTVPVGQERLRVTPTPGHVAEFRADLVEALDVIWTELGIKRTSDWAAQGGFIGVGEPEPAQQQAGEEAEAKNAPLWTDAQLGIEQAAKEILAAGEPPAGRFTESLLERESATFGKAAAAAAAAAA